MIELNLLPEELQKKEYPKLVLPEIPIKKTLVIFLIAFFGLQILASLFAFYEKIDLDRVKKEAAFLTEVNREVISQKSEITQMRNRLKEIDLLTTRPIYWSSLLNGLSDSMIKGVWLNGLSVQSQAPAVPAARDSKGRGAGNLVRVLKLEGSVVSRGDETAYIGKFIKELKSNTRLAELFTDIDLSDMNQKKIKEFDVYDFVLMCFFKREKTS